MSASTFDAVYDRANRLSTKPDLDPEIQAEINRLWRKIHGGYDYSNPEEFGRFLSWFLRARYQRVDPDERSEHLCQCGNPYCNVLSGKIPVRLQPVWQWSDTDAGAIAPTDARQYVNEHAGCVAIEDALSAWTQGQQQTEAALRRIIALASSNGATTSSVDFADGNIPGGGDE